MATLKEKLSGDLKASLKSGDKEKVSLLRFLLAQIHNREIEKHAQEPHAPLSDDEVRDVLQKELKKRKEAIELFRRGKREDLASHEEREAALLGEYLPKPLGGKEIEEEIDKLFSAGFRDMNSLIREAMKRLRGKADGRLVSELVKKKVGGA